MKSIIVFGGSGYIGSTVTDLLLAKGYKVLNLDKVEPNIKFSDNPNYKWNKFDLRNEYEFIDNATKEFIEDSAIGAIHFAAFKDIEESYKYSFMYYDNNIKSLLTALSYSYELGVKTFLFSSSAAVYQDDKVGLVSEDAMNGFSDSPYGYTKVVGEQIVKDVCKEFEMKGVSLRYFNPIGCSSVSHDTSDSLFGSIWKCLLGDTELTIFGDDYPTRDGTPIRDYIDLRDLAEAHLYALLHSELSYDVFNVGTGTGITVKEVAETVKSLNPKFKYKIGERRLGDSSGGYADITKIKKLGFKCQYTLKDSIKTLIKP